MEDRDIYQKLLDYEVKLSNLRVFGKWIPDDEIQLYFNASDVVVLPYTRITTSGVIPLAYAFSKAVITTDIGGLKGVVNGSAGIVVSPENVVELRRAIQRIFTMDYLTMGKCGKDYAEKELSWASNAAKIKGLYRAVGEAD